MNLNSLLLRIVLYTWGIALLCYVTAMPVMDLHIHNWDGIWYLEVPALVLLLIPLISRLSNIWLHRPSRRQAFWTPLRCHIAHEFPILQRFSVPMQAAIALCSMFATAIAFPRILWYGGITIAYCLYSIGAFVPGERVFSLIPDINNCKFGKSVAAGWDYDHTTATLGKIDHRLDAVIATVYGAESSQMAHRWDLIGGRYRLRTWKAFSGGQPKVAVKLFHDAQFCYEKSLPLHRRLRDAAACAETLSKLAYCQVKQGDVQSAKESLNGALGALGLCEDQTYLVPTIDRLAMVANLTGNHDEATILYYQSDRITKSSGFARDVPNFLWLMLPLVLATCLIIHMVRFYLISKCAKRWRESRQNASDPSVRFRAIDKLITLELYHGNFTKADLLSKELFAAASNPLL